MSSTLSFPPRSRRTASPPATAAPAAASHASALRGIGGLAGRREQVEARAEVVEHEAGGRPGLRGRDDRVPGAPDEKDATRPERDLELTDGRLRPAADTVGGRKELGGHAPDLPRALAAP